MLLSCPAKINLFLALAGTLPGGYHAIDTLMQRVGLADELEVDAAPGGELALACDISPTACPEDNLVVRAARLLREAAGRPELGARFLLKKRIPSGAGLGGGSSDAASALLALNRVWGLELPQDELGRLAARLGSDVPFFLGSPAARCRGRGELLEPLPPRPLQLVIVKPPQSLATPAVYGRYDALGRPAPEPEAFYAAYAGGDWRAIGAALHNDLEAPAGELEPALAGVLDLLRRETPYALMTGSGSACFGLFENLAAATAAAGRLQAARPDCLVAATQTLVR